MRLRVDAGEEKEQKTGLWHPVLDESTKRSTNLSPRFSGTTQYPDPARVAGDNAQLNQISPVADSSASRKRWPFSRVKPPCSTNHRQPWSTICLIQSVNPEARRMLILC
ncbi:hypothetical protein [Klebsiella sp. CN_Kp100]|uniref:hypothetical protein n=1 Tax=Klebsiella sp. CN_Kp100 TaxID=3153422 RepID=UPI0032B4BD91